MVSNEGYRARRAFLYNAKTDGVTLFCIKYIIKFVNPKRGYKLV
jgi:hypothetical protein